MEILVVVLLVGLGIIIFRTLSPKPTNRDEDHRGSVTPDSAIDRAVNLALKQGQEKEQREKNYQDSKVEWDKERVNLDAFYSLACRQLVESFDRVVSQFNSKFEDDKIKIKSSQFEPCASKKYTDREYLVPTKATPPSRIRCWFFPNYSHDFVTSDKLKNGIIGGCYLGTILRIVDRGSYSDLFTHDIFFVLFRSVKDPLNPQWVGYLPQRTKSSEDVVFTTEDVTAADAILAAARNSDIYANIRAQFEYLTQVASY